MNAFFRHARSPRLAAVCGLALVSCAAPKAAVEPGSLTVTEIKTAEPAKPSIFSIFTPWFLKPQSKPPAEAANPGNAIPPLFASPDMPRDPQPAVEVTFKVDVYKLTLPYGAVSQSAEFWSRLNELLIDPASYDVLQRNGIRVGEAAFADWAYFKSLIDQHPGTSTQTVAVARESKNMQLEMKKDVQSQDLFHFDRRNTMTGRSYDRCDNLISMSFEPTPRRPGSMRLTLAPVVRTQRKRLEFSVLNDERAELAYVSPEMLYDCNLRLDIPLESFIVVAPSPEASWPLSVGHALFIKDGESQREEHVLLIVPRAFRTEDRR